MSAYVIGHITIRDQAKWMEYRSQVPETLVAWNARLVFRGRKASVLAGSHDHTETLLIEFPGLEAVNGWYGSQAYQALVALRNEAADVDLISYLS